MGTEHSKLFLMTRLAKVGIVLFNERDNIAKQRAAVAALETCFMEDLHKIRF